MPRRKEHFRTDETKRNIEKYGNQLIGVYPTTTDVGEHPFFTYTIGNHERGYPEFLCIAPGDTCGPILNALTMMQKEENKALTGDISLGGEFPVRLVNATNRAKAEFTFQVERYYKTQDYKVTQVLLCDTKGRYPGEEDCEEPYLWQPVLSDN